jgi:hypothetical protein
LRSVKNSFASFDALLCDSDHTDAATLDRVAADNFPGPDLLFHLIELAESSEPNVQRAATALLKRYQERGTTFDADQVARLLELLPSARHWEATLHLLQMLAHLTIPPSQAESLCDSLRGLSRHRNAFVRAWAYGGLHRLATLYPEYLSEVSPLLDRAAQEEAASVRARLRQLPPLNNLASISDMRLQTPTQPRP